jgi:catechol 2,3-dioxygenase-like lactoylglutathione lyase family enzyme
MRSLDATPRVTSLAPQFLVDDLARSMAYYAKLGFTFGAPWNGFYAIGMLDGLELHLKEAPKHEAERRFRREHEHLDAAAGVDGIEAFYARCVANGVTVLKPLAPTGWGTQDFYVEDPDGYVLAFGGRPASE